MASLVAKRTRGRKKGLLRIFAATLAPKVGGGNDKVFTVEVAPANGRKKADTLEISVPSGTKFIPVEMTKDKKEENVREQLRLAVGDSKVENIGVASADFTYENGDAGILWMLVQRAPKKESKAPAKAPAKGRAKK